MNSVIRRWCICFTDEICLDHCCRQLTFHDIANLENFENHDIVICVWKKTSNFDDTWQAPIGLEVNWDKTKVQALRTQQPDTETLDVQGNQVAVVDEFVYLGALTHSSVHSSYDIQCHVASLAVRCKNLTIASGNHGSP